MGDLLMLIFYPVAAENLHVLAIVLRSGDQPPLSRAQFQRVMYAHRAHKEYVRYQESLADSDDDEGPQEEEAWLFEDLSILAKLYARLKDREQLIELIFEVSYLGCNWLDGDLSIYRALQQTFSRTSSRFSTHLSHRCTGPQASPTRLVTSRIS